MQEAYESIRDRALEDLEEYDFEAQVTLVGSAARDTWLEGDRDIDVFLLLPPYLDRKEFQEIGLEVGQAVFPDGRVEYAEHPYVQGVEDGYDVDVVPCYSLDDASEVQSAVDRTPFHPEYVERERFEGFSDEARLLKAFCRGAGVYGSDLRTHGFGGYLCELLVLHYGGFQEVVEAAADWTPQVVIEFQTAERSHDDPLVVVDPVDAERNVASVVSEDSLATLIHHSRQWLENPATEAFDVEEPIPVSEEELRSYVEGRDTYLAAWVFQAPDVVEDQLYPQLRKTETSLVEELERQGFDVIRSHVFADDRATLLVEANVGRQSKVERHEGPPVYVEEHADEFYRKYEDSDDVVGPYIDDGRYVVERPRRYTSIEEFLESDAVFDLALGQNLEREIERGYDVIVDEELTSLLDEFAVELASHLRPGL